MNSAAMKEAQQILSTFTDDELQGFLLMFGQKRNSSAESEKERKARKLAAAQRIAARRVALPNDFDELQEMMEYLDERNGL